VANGKVDLKDFHQQMGKAKKLADDLPEQAYHQFIKNTPVDTGNARKRTKLQNNTIVADYVYSQRLDAGYSDQAPKGMVEPTEKWIQQEVDRRLKGL
jgi:hypothetical protein